MALGCGPGTRIRTWMRNMRWDMSQSVNLGMRNNLGQGLDSPTVVGLKDGTRGGTK